MISVKLFLLRKGVYPYRFLDNWEKFNETPKKNSKIPNKGEFSSNLHMENITDSDYNHANRICKDFEIRNLGEYLDLYLKSDMLL